VVTYPLAPELPFGLLLLAMGVMASDLRPRLRSQVYVPAFVFVLLIAERAFVLDLIAGALAR